MPAAWPPRSPSRPAARGVPARALRERVLLEPASRPHRHDVRRDAGRRAGGPRSSSAPTPDSGCARTASRWPRCCSGWSTPGRCRSPGSRWSGTRWAAWSMRAAGAVAAEPAAQDWNAPGHRRRHPRHPAPRRADRLGDRARQPRARPAARDGGVRPDPRLALGRRPRPGGRAGRGRAAAPARALPPGLRDADRVAAAPGRARRGRPAGAAAVGVRPRTGAAGSCSPAPTCCTSAAPTTSGCSTIPTYYRAMERWLA